MAAATIEQGRGQTTGRYIPQKLSLGAFDEAMKLANEIPTRATVRPWLSLVGILIQRTQTHLLPEWSQHMANLGRHYVKRAVVLEALAFGNMAAGNSDVLFHTQDRQEMGDPLALEWNPAFIEWVARPGHILAIEGEQGHYKTNMAVGFYNYALDRKSWLCGSNMGLRAKAYPEPPRVVKSDLDLIDLAYHVLLEKAALGFVVTDEIDGPLRFIRGNSREVDAAGKLANQLRKERTFWVWIIHQDRLPPLIVPKDDPYHYIKTTIRKDYWIGEDGAEHRFRDPLRSASIETQGRPIANLYGITPYYEFYDHEAPTYFDFDTDRVTRFHRAMAGKVGRKQRLEVFERFLEREGGHVEADNLRELPPAGLNALEGATVEELNYWFRTMALVKMKDYIAKCRPLDWDIEVYKGLKAYGSRWSDRRAAVLFGVSDTTIRNYTDKEVDL